jgi:pyruvate/2-oxoglutarate dehydrogenase complex dihydrolipoamide dehydrogenase (E3) component
MKYDYHVIVIGAGSAGLVCAAGCAKLGAKTALVEKGDMGGDCLNTGCVPSKSFIKIARIARTINKSEEYGIEGSLEKVDLVKVMNKVRDSIEEIEPYDSVDRFEKMGIDVYNSEAVLKDRNTVIIGDEVITSKYIVIATGSKPRKPDIEGIELIEYYTNENIFSCSMLPEHLVILGSGPVAMEIGQSFRYLGSKVSIINRKSNIFKKDDREVDGLMREIMKNDGVEILYNTTVDRISKKDGKIILSMRYGDENRELECDTFMVASGRVPNSDGLGLENIGLDIDERGYVLTDSKMRTNIKNIFASGDVTGPWLFTHTAGYQAGIVIKNIIFVPFFKTDYSFVPWTTYTSPEVAHVGLTENQAKDKGSFGRSVFANLKDNDRAITERERMGFCKIILNKKGRVIGGTIVSESSGEILPLISLAVRHNKKLSYLGTIIYAYPTEAEVVFDVYLKGLQELVSERTLKIIKKIFIR